MRAEGLVHSRFLSSRLYNLRINPAGQRLQESSVGSEPLSADPPRPESPARVPSGQGRRAGSGSLLCPQA